MTESKVNYFLNPANQGNSMQTKLKEVIKRDGSIEPFMPEKLNNWAKWSCKGSTASWSSLVLTAVKQISDSRVTTDFLQELLITTAMNLLDEDPAYDKVAVELMIAQLRKQLFDSYYPPHLKSFHDHMVEIGQWSNKAEWLSAEDFEYLNSIIDHERDHLFTSAGFKQFKDKYSRRSTITNEIFETPQFAYMGMVMEMLALPHWDLDDAEELYNALSLQKVNVPTPPLVGLRSGDRGFASCCLVDATDTLQSIDAAEHVVFNMVAARAGIGYHLESRSLADPVRNGTFPHSGKLPYYRHIDRSVKSNTQQCYSADTEILTKTGWKLFSELTGTEKIAQVTDTRGLEWVVPINIYEYDYNGTMLRFEKRGIDLLVTPNHSIVYRQVAYDNKQIQRSPGYQEVLAEDWAPKRTHALDFGSANKTSGTDVLTTLDKFRIALQADGSIIETDTGRAYRFGFKKERKIMCLEAILNSLGLKFSKKVNDQGVTNFRVNHEQLHYDKDLTFLLEKDLTSSAATRALEEIMEWDGYWKSERVGEYTNHSGQQHIVQALAAIAGLRSNTSTANRCYVYFDQKDMTAEAIRESEVDYEGKVYCVEVPTHKLVVRRNGHTSVCGNSRGGSATVYYAFFDPEIIKMIQVKSQRSAQEDQIDKMDYNLKYNQLLFKRYVKKQDITLMSFFYAPEVWEAFHSGSYEEFERLYIAAEKRLENETKVGFKGERLPVAPKIPAADILEEWVTVRMETGRAYAMDIAETNRNSRFSDPIRMSNLCVEIVQPTYPIRHVVDMYRKPEELDMMDPSEYGEVSLCNLGGIALGRIHSLEEWESISYILLKFVDSIIDIQDYPFPTLAYTAKKRRNVGIGLMNAAGAMAEVGLAYEGVEARNWIHREAEKASYFLHKASVRLAQEVGAADWFHRTRTSKGELLVDTYKKTVDDLVTVGLEMDWESLRSDILKYGMRNSVLMANMPGESSSVLLGVTNSVEPPRGPLTVKTSGVNKVVSLVPNINDWDIFVNYKYAFELDRTEHIKWIAVLQKFTCQSSSAQLYYDYNKYPKGIIPQAEVIKDLMNQTKYGIKTIYYANFDVDNGGAANSGCESGACQI